MTGPVLAWIAAMSVITAFVYAYDKAAARRRGVRRIRERNLWLLSLAGGVPGAWLAFFGLRHKTLHGSFWVVQGAATVLWVVIVALVAGADPVLTQHGPGPYEPAASGGDIPGGGTDRTRALDGRTFTGLVITGTGAGLVDVTLVRLAFHGVAIEATGGCNTLGGPYGLSGDVLMVGNLTQTDLVCERAVADQDAWLASFIDGATMTLRGSRMTLARDGVTLVLTDATGRSRLRLA